MVNNYWNYFTICIFVRKNKQPYLYRSIALLSSPFIPLRSFGKTIHPQKITIFFWEASTKSALHQSSTDGAYGIYVPLGKLKAGETKSAVFYYGVPQRQQVWGWVGDSFEKLEDTVGVNK